MREIVFDTETTGKRYQEGHRVVEIAAVELIDGKPTGKEFRVLINPERHIPDEVVAIHGITNEMVADAPRFRDILPQFLEFFRGARVIAHNSDFDERFLNNELELVDHPESFWSIVSETVDTIEMSRRIWVGKDPETDKTYRHSLDAVLDRCKINRDERVLHGALIDSQLLAKAYLHMRELIIAMGPTLEEDLPRPPIVRVPAMSLPVLDLPESALAADQAYKQAVRPAGPKP